jgi:hypothetical protein
VGPERFARAVPASPNHQNALATVNVVSAFSVTMGNVCLVAEPVVVVLEVKSVKMVNVSQT